jgi:hypothetical protein
MKDPECGRPDDIMWMAKDGSFRRLPVEATYTGTFVFWTFILSLFAGMLFGSELQRDGVLDRPYEGDADE